MRGLLPDLTPMRRSPAFRRLLAGGLLSSLGSSMTSFAVVLQIWDISRSSFAVGALGLAQFGPVLIVGLVGGAFADSVDRRRLALLTSACLAVVSALFAVQAFAGFGRLWVLYMLATAQSALWGLGAPASATFVARLLPPDQRGAGIALRTLSGRVTMLAGPALAGLIAGAAGLRTCYVIDAFSFLAVLYATARLPPMRAQLAPAPAGNEASQGKPSGSPVHASRIDKTASGIDKTASRIDKTSSRIDKTSSRIRETAAGLRFIRRRPLLLAAFLTDLDAMLLGLPVALFPALNAAHFGGAPQTLGLLNAAPGVGGLLSATLSGPASRVRRQGRGMLAGTMTWGAAIAGFGMARGLPLGLTLLAVAGAADTLTVTFRSSMVQTVTPDEFRGRVSSVEYIIGTGGAPLGNLESGTVASLTTPSFSAASGGVGCLACAVLIAMAFPALTRYRAPRAAAPASGPAGAAVSAAAAADA